MLFIYYKFHGKICQLFDLFYLVLLHVFFVFAHNDDQLLDD